MTRWITNDRDRLCGACGRHIRIGEPVHEIFLPGIDAPKTRCKRLECAGEPVPADVPPAVTRVDIPAMVRLGSVKGGLPLDFKAIPSRPAAAGRDPGEEG